MPSQSGCPMTTGSTATKTTVVSMDPPATAPTLTLSATNSDGSYPVSWNAVSGAANYKWQERINGGTWSSETTTSGTGISPSPSGKTSATYSYRVRACNDNGCTGYSAENSIIVAVAPGVPASISASPNPSTGNVTVSWGTASGSVTKYDFDYKLSTSGTWTNGYDGTGLSKALSGLSVGTWEYRVRACKTQSTYTSCSGWRSGSSVIMVPPAAPTFTGPAGNYSGDSFTVSWTSISGAANYELQQRINSSGWATIQNTSATSKPINGTIGNDYSYQVRACNVMGCSAYSAVKTVMAGARLTVPATDSDGDGSFTIAWAGGENVVRVWEKVPGGSWVNLSAPSVNAPSGDKTRTHNYNGTYEYSLEDCYYEGSQYGGTTLHCTTSDTGSVVVSGINNTPTISNISNRNINENGNTGNIAFTVSDPETSAGSLTVTATSSNTTLVPNSGSNLTLGGSGGNRTIKVTPAANQHGTATITVTVSDGTLSASDTFLLAVNGAPSISNIGNQSIEEDNNTGNITFTVSDPETSAGSLTVTATSGNTTLVPNSGSNLTLGGSGGSRTIKVTPAPNKYGTATITVTVSDGTVTASDTFVVTVNSVNDAPTISDIGNRTISEDDNTGSIAFTVNDVETAAASLTVTATSSDITLVPNNSSNLALGGSGGNRTILVIPATNKHGTATITVTVSDGSLSASDTFVVTVNSVNDLPTISAIGNASLDEGESTGAISFTVGDVETAVTSLTVTASSSNTNVIPIGNITLSGSDANRTIQVSAKPAGGVGTSTITVTVSDGEESRNETFTVTVADTPAELTVPASDNDGTYTISWVGGHTVVRIWEKIGSGDWVNLSTQEFFPPYGSQTITHLSNGTYQYKIDDCYFEGSQHGVTTHCTTTDTGSVVVTLPVPTATAGFSPSTISEGGSSTFSWSSTDANDCIATGISGVSGTSDSITYNASSTLASDQTINVTVTCTGYGGSDSASASLTVNWINDNPTISGIDDITINEDNNTGDIGFIIGDEETGAGELIVTATSDNTTLIPNGNITLGGSGATRTVRATPVTHLSGTATITVSVSDGVNAPVSEPFTVIVNSVNDIPTITSFNDISMPKDTVTDELDFSISDVETPAASLIVTAYSSDTQLIPNSNLILGGSDGNRTLMVIPASGQTGIATITVEVSDGEGSNSTSFDLSVVGEAAPFDFAADAPPEFQYDLNDTSFLPMLGNGDFVALTEGEVNVHNGAAQYTLPLELPPAINDLKPKLALTYNSRGGNGLLGVGWSLSGLSVISRCPPSVAAEGEQAQDSNPKYTNADRLCLDGKKLEIESSASPVDDSVYWASGAEYRTEIDNFAKVQAYGTLNGSHSYFEVRTKDGRILTYGGEATGQNSRIYAAGQSSAGPVSIWALDKVQDRYGNEYTIHYQRNNADGDYYPTHINFSPNASVVFSYIERDADDADMDGYRSDMPWGYDKGHLHKHPKLLDKITTYTDGGSTAVREYNIDYRRSATTHRYLIDMITECGFESGSSVCAEPLTFDWQAGELGFETNSSPLLSCSGQGIDVTHLQAGDIDNDGYDDLFGDGALYWGGADCFSQAGAWATEGSDDWKTERLIATPSGKALLVTEEDPDSVSIGAPTKLFIGTIELNRTAGTADYTRLTPNSVYPTSVVIIDMNSDGLEDFLFGDNAWIQQQGGPLGFTPVTDNVFLHITGSGTPVEYNSDGLTDLFMHYPEPLNSWYENNDVNVRRNTGIPGQLNLAYFLPVSDTQPHEMWISAILPNLEFPGSQFYNLVDVNGDGKRDYAYHRIPEDPNVTEGTWYLHLNTGDGFGPQMDTGISSGPRTNQYSYPYDWDKDGREDLIAICGQRCWHVLLSSYDSDSGGFTFEVLNTDPFNGNLDGLAELPFAKPEAQILRGDFNHDGLVDVAFYSSVWYAKQQQPDLLKTVTNGFGAQIQLEYSPLVSDENLGQPLYTPASEKPVFPQRHAHRSMQVVKKLSVSNGQGGWRERYFNYTGAKQDAHGRGFLGFEKIEVTDTAADKVKTVTYRQDFPFIGSVGSVEVKDTAGKLISWVSNTYAVHEQNPRFAYLDQALEGNYGLTTSSLDNPLSVTWIDNTFDAYGNLADRFSVVGTGLDSGGGLVGVQRVVTLQNQLSNNVADWLLGFVEVRIETAAEAGGVNPRTVTTSFVPEDGTLDVKIRTDFVGTPVWKTTTTTRNPNGIVEDVTVSAGDIDGGTAAARSTAWSNFANVMYPQTQTNAKGHASTLGYDTRFGIVNSQTDANSLTLTREYDALGRLKSETASDGTVTAVKRFYCASAPVICPGGAVYLVVTETANSAAPGKLGAPLSIVYYDQLQREVRRETYSLDGAVVKVDTEYYADGRVHRVSEPYTGLANHWTGYSNYDALDRPHDISGADGGSVHYDYLREGDLQKTVETVTVLTPDGNRTQVKTSYTNALGQVERVLDDEQTPVDYAYDTQGNLESTTVNNNTATTIAITHDVAGNKTYISDPDAGVINFEYNGFGELRRQIWRQGTADEKSITYTYDVLGRKTGRTDTPVGGSPVSYTWSWDAAKKGLLDSRSGNGFTEIYAYDSQSRLFTQTTTIDGLSSQVFSYTYDAFSRPQTVTYPNDFKIEHRYHAAGVQVQTLDITVDPPTPKVLWALGENSNERGNLYQQLFGNGVMTEQTLDASSGRLKRIQSGRLLGSSVSELTGSVQDLSFEFDTLGNLYERSTSRTDLNGLPLEYTAEIFTYDDLNRLKTSDTLWDSLGTRDRSYEYDALGNLTYRSDIGTLSYDQGNGAGVHAVTGANGQSYEYDAYGNMKKRGADTLEYDVFNKPTKIGSTYFSYGPDHERFKQVDGSRTTYYFGGGQYEEIIEAGVTTQRSHVGGYLVRNTSQGNTTLTYLHSDHLGSVDAMSDELGNFIGRMSFDPWGLRQNPDWDDDPIGVDPINEPGHYPTTRGYTGHEMLDQVNLVHMNGRVYDPVVGRFLSPDLYIQAPYNTQSFNRYSYVFNNPLSSVDPTGYECYTVTTSSGGKNGTFSNTQRVCTGGNDRGMTFTGMGAYYFMQSMAFFNNGWGPTIDQSPTWMDVAREEIGQSEVAGSNHNEQIIDYHSKTSLNAKDDETPWCSSFCNWVMGKDGKTGTNSAAAKSWTEWGKKSEPLEGALAIIRKKGSEEGKGYHVGFLIEETSTHFKVLGGNQSDQVKESSFSKKNWELIDYRWPE